MTWPTDDLTTVSLNESADDPSEARAELYAAVVKLKAILAEAPFLKSGGGTQTVTVPVIFSNNVTMGLELVYTYPTMRLRSDSSHGIYLEDASGNDLGLWAWDSTSDYIYLRSYDDVGATSAEIQLYGDESKINFAADSIQFNDLEAYSTGTFTPKIQDDSFSDGEGQTYTTQIGRYTKIFNRVFFTINLDVSSTGTLSGQAYITNLPFTSVDVTNNNQPVNVGIGVSMSLGGQYAVNGYIPKNSSLILLTAWQNTTGTSGVSFAQLTSAFTISISGQYEIAV